MPRGLKIGLKTLKYRNTVYLSMNMTKRRRTTNRTLKIMSMTEHISRDSDDLDDNKKELFLNDEIINKYMDLITERSPDTVYAFNTFFYFALSDKGYPHVSRWTKKIDIFTKSKLFIPVHVEGDSHWCLACIDFQAKTISYYDSLGGRNFKCLKLLLKYLIMEHLDKKKIAFKPTGWALTNIRKCPQQENLWDCGVFVCMFAEYLARDAKLDFCQDDMPNFRDQLFNEIKNNKLINQSES